MPTEAIKRRWPAVLIDLDGTLVDSVPDLAISINLMRADLGLPSQDEGLLRTFVGNGVWRLVERSLAGTIDGLVDDKRVEEAYPLFLNHYRDHLCDKSVCYPGVNAGLERMSRGGIMLACVTNKPESFSHQLLEQLGIRHYFCSLVGGDTLTDKKPHPEPLRHAARGLGFAVESCILVGDSASDIKAARAAGCDSICVSYGYNQGVDLESLKPTYLVDKFAAAVDEVLRLDGMQS
ncbi:MAG: phosphoglycolate phosphatase, bacterial [marine bacterium B5-7]|nr:MAG: phosphoglycolate phosphatase, bacterial [marine bacterium B5-7]